MNMMGSGSIEDIFVIKVKEVQYIAEKEFGRCLDEIEIKEVQKRIQFGLECWEEVVIHAIHNVIDSKNK